MTQLKTRVQDLHLHIRTSALVALVFIFPICMWAVSREVLVADGSSQMVQNSRADFDDLSRMSDVSMMRRFARNGYLVSVPSNTRAYYLHSIPAAYRYCRPWTKLFLDRLSRQFYARFKQRLRVTSLVRTEASQTKLARYNPNAADATGSLRSSHLTGASLDISKRWMSPEDQRWMRDVLYSLREQGYVYAIEEFGQPTFHVMVYRNYPEYVKRLSAKAPSNLKDLPPAHISRLIGVRVITRLRWARIIVNLDGAASYTSGHLTNPERVYFDLANTVLAKRVTIPALGDSPVAAMRIAQFSTTTVRIVVDVTGRGDCSSFMLPNPDRLVIDVRPGTLRPTESAVTNPILPTEIVPARAGSLPPHLRYSQNGIQYSKKCIHVCGKPAKCLKTS